MDRRVSVAGVEPWPGGVRLITMAAAAASQQGADLGSAAGAVMEGVCRAMAWPVGYLLLAGRDPLRTGDPRANRALWPTSMWHMEDPDRFRVLRQVILASGSSGMRDMPSVKIPDRPMAFLKPDDLVESARVAGLASAFTFPVMAAAVSDGSLGAPEVAATLVFLADTGAPVPAPDRLEMVAMAVDQLGRTVDRERARSAVIAHRRTVEAVGEALVELDAAGMVIDWNQSAEMLFGWTRDEALGHSLAELVVAPRHRLGHARILRGLVEKRPGDALREGELIVITRGGRAFPVRFIAWAGAQGGAGTSLMLRRAPFAASADPSASLVLHDRLTGLANGVLLADRVQHGLVRASAAAPVGLVLVGLERPALDRAGVPLEDRLMSLLAGRLVAICGPIDTVARVGPARFAVLWEDLTDPDDARHRAERILDTVTTVADAELDPGSPGGPGTRVIPSVGAALAWGPEAAADELFRQAELALQRAQQRGGGCYEVADHSDRHRASPSSGMEGDLRRAIDEGQLHVVYQPIVRIDTGALSGFEALVRWQHPERGLVSPADFIPTAERSGLVVPLGRFVMSQACRQAAAWQRLRPSTELLRLSVNVSVRQLAHPGWASEVFEALDQSGIEPEQLVLEVTESALMQDVDAVIGRLQELRQIGVRVAIDDFGTGYSSLSYLRRLPVDVLKIDKSFIDGIAEGPHESALARAVIKLAATLNLDAVAEGVATRPQLTQLKRLRCPYGQGYLFSRPQPPEEFENLVAAPTLPGS